MMVELGCGDIIEGASAMTFQGKIHNGVVVFNGPVNLPEGTPVTVWPEQATSPRPSGHDEKMSEDEHRRIMPIMDRIAALPDENPGDTFSGADHDQALYGEP